MSWQILWVLISYFKEMAGVAKRKRERERADHFLIVFFFFASCPTKSCAVFAASRLALAKMRRESFVECRWFSLSLFLFLAPKLGPKIKYSFGWSAQQSRTVRYGIPSVRRHVDLVLQAGPVLFFCFSRFFFVGQHSAGHLARVLYYQRPLKDRGSPFMPFSINTSY